MIFCKLLSPALFCILVGLLGGCSSSPRFAERSNEGKTSAKNEGAAAGRPKSNGKVLLTLEGVASYYADDFHGKQASNGEIFDMNALVAAHRTFPFGTKVRVTNLDNNKQTTVRVIDRGPFKEGRIIDLSLGAAKQIDLVKTGTAKVRLEVVEWGDGKLYH
jgi:rare lipoprotein A